MNDILEGLPSIRNMFKLVIVLLFAVIAMGLVMAIVKLLIPLLIVAAIVAGGVYLYNKLQTNGAAS